MIELTKEFRFEAAHQLPGYVGACSNIHGHSYRLWVTVAGEPQADGPCEGMVMDFAHLGRIVKDNIVTILDHALILKRGCRAARLLEDWEGQIVYVDFQPTCELLLLDFERRLRYKLPGGVRLVELRLAETDSNVATLRLRS